MTELSLLEYVGFLIEAAEFIKAQEAEKAARQRAEHGYACSTAPLPPVCRPSPPAGKPSRRHRRSSRRSSFTLLTSSGRSTHNELEKNRRAQLRSCFDRLKEVVPCHSGRHTTQGLLINAQQLIKSLEQKMRLGAETKCELEESQRRLKQRLAQLTANTYRSGPSGPAGGCHASLSRSPTSSESTRSSSSASFSYSPSPSSDYEPIDVIGSSTGSDASSDVDSLDSGDVPSHLVPYTSMLALVDTV
jgi:MAX dimerization protein